MSVSKYTPRDIEKLLLQFFGLSKYVTEEELKSAFRARAKQLHPDIDPLAGDKFVEMKEVYDFITSNANFLSGKSVPRTIEGVELSSLGLGLGPMKNGKDCGICQHKGYVEHILAAFQECSTCNGRGITIFVVCPKCKGVGSYKNKRGDQEFKCFKCDGTGRMSGGFKVTVCVSCKGYGRVATPALDRRSYEVCYKCNGSGEIEIYNPVLPKGLLAVR